MKKLLMLPWRLFIFLRQSFVNIIFFFILIGIIGAFTQDDSISVPESAVLTVAPAGRLVNQETYTDPFAELMGNEAPSETLVSDLENAINAATSDDRIKGIQLYLNNFAGGSLANLHRVAVALETFKASGKPIYAFADSYSQSAYFLAASATEVHQPPMGSTLLTGFGSYNNYFAGLMDKLGVNVHVFKVGRYKSAVEPFFLTGMSDDARANATEYMGDLWGSYTASVEERRELAPGMINDMIANIGTNLQAVEGDVAKLGVDLGLVDHLSYRDQLRMKLIELVGEDEDGSYSSIGVHNYLSVEGPVSLPSNNQIAHIVASGAIMGGNQNAGTIGGLSLSKLIRQAREDENVKAIVLQVESPGGSAFASERIRRELELAQEASKPVVVSMGSVAASGGYWISATADKIWAQPETITGSIGVFGVIPTFEDTFAKVGLTTDGVGTTQLAGAMRTDRPLSNDVKDYIQGSIDTIYDQFLGLVAKGRNMTKEEVHAIAQGKVWTGKRAIDIGLVDAHGDIHDAIEDAAKLAGLSDYQVKLIEKELTPEEQFIKELRNMSVSLGFNPNQSTLSKWVTRFEAQAKPLTELDDPNHAYVRCFDCEVDGL